MILFSLKNYEKIGAELQIAVPGWQSGACQLTRFPNGELHAVVDTPVACEDCAVLGSIAPPEEQLLSVLLLGHTLKKEGAGKLTALLNRLAFVSHAACFGRNGLIVRRRDKETWSH